MTFSRSRRKKVSEHEFEDMAKMEKNLSFGLGGGWRADTEEKTENNEK